jgi:hypothetical protein
MKCGRIKEMTDADGNVLPHADGNVLPHADVLTSTNVSTDTIAPIDFNDITDSIDCFTDTPVPPDETHPNDIGVYNIDAYDDRELPDDYEDALKSIAIELRGIQH